MSKSARERVAEKAARLIVDGVENEYLDAKDRAIMMLGLDATNHRPTNRKIRDYISLLTKEELGTEEVNRRLKEMRLIALDLMQILDDFDPFLIGSVLSGQIRTTSDIDLHAFSDDQCEIMQNLEDQGYEDVEEELIENQKGRFIHLKWKEKIYPVEITVYPWSWRDIVPISSITGQPMKRADVLEVKRLLARS